MPRLISNILLFSTLLSFVSIAEASDSLCQPSEVIRFTCAIGNSGKLVSVCSSSTLTRTSGYLQYRFGTRKKVELEFPATTEKTQEAFTFESHSELGDWEGLNFTIGSYGYTVHRWVRKSSLADSPDSAGVMVYRIGDSSSDRLLTELKCSSERIESPMELSSVIQEAK